MFRCVMSVFQGWIIYVVVCAITCSYGCYVIVEKEHPTTLQCSFANNVKSITWQLLDGNTTINLSTCSFVDNNCTDQHLPALYKGFISNSGEDRGIGLSVTSARVNETHFSCLNNDDQKSSVCQLEVFAWPEKPQCSQSITNTHMEFVCTTNNVYPSLDAVLRRNESDFTDSDSALIIKQCTLGTVGSGTGGDFTATCTWRVPIENITPDTIVFSEMSARVSNRTLINLTPVLSSPSTIPFTVPVAVLAEDNCPDGHGVFRNSILIGAKTECTCYLKKWGYPIGTVQWYTRDNMPVGDVYSDNRSAAVTFSYNSSDPNQSYECRPATKLKAKVDSVIYTPQYRCSYVIVEKGQPTHFECPVLNTMSSLTWQVLNNASTTLNISTCSLVNNTCDDTLPSLYKGFIFTSGGVTMTGLNVTGARTNETLFAYLTDNGTRSTISELEVYVWPSKPICTQNITLWAVIFTCTTDNVYPAVRTSVHRRGTKLTYDDLAGAHYIDTKNIPCSRGDYGSGALGDYSASCSFQINLRKMIPESHIYVKMFASISVRSIVNNTAVVSEDIVTNNIFPTASLVDCPFGPGVRGNAILIGTNATCTCKGTPTRYFTDGFVRWYTTKWNIVGTNTGMMSSTLTVQYNPLENNETFLCAAQIGFGTLVDSQYYTPKYRSDPSVVLKDCPSGPGVKGIIIRIGTNATCRCEVTKSEFIESGFARWFTSKGEIVGKEDVDNSSTLVVSYNSSYSHEPYGCWALTSDGFSANVKYFIPNFKSAPSVVLRSCPSGTGVKGNTIRKKTNATCRCEVTKSEVSESGFARWFTSKGEIVGKEDIDNSSTLLISYKSSDAVETYGCWAMTSDGRTTNVEYYTPSFTSSATSNTILELQGQIVTFLTVFFIIASRME